MNWEKQFNLCNFDFNSVFIKQKKEEGRLVLVLSCQHVLAWAHLTVWGGTGDGWKVIGGQANPDFHQKKVQKVFNSGAAAAQKRCLDKK